MEGMTVLNNIIGGKVQAIHAHKRGVAIHNDRVAACMMSSNLELFDKSSIEVLEPILHLPPANKVSFVATTGHNVNTYAITQPSCDSVDYVYNTLQVSLN